MQKCSAKVLKSVNRVYGKTAHGASCRDKQPVVSSGIDAARMQLFSTTAFVMYLPYSFFCHHNLCDQQTFSNASKAVSLMGWVQGTVASVQQDMQQRLEEALAENKAQTESLREARERNMHFSARIVALNSRVAQLTKQV